MALIKANDAKRAAQEAIVLDLGDLQKQADELRQHARRDAQRIRDEAHAEAQRLTEQARQRGYEAGFEQGKQEGYEAGRKQGHEAALNETRQQIEQIQQAWIQAAHQWDEQRQRMIADARRSLLDLAVRIAEKIVRRVPELDPSVVVDQAHEALDQVARPCDVTLRITPEDRPLLEQAMPQLLEQASQAEHIHLVTDESVGRGGCVVTYGRGRIDATLDKQLDRLVHTLLPPDESETAQASPIQNAETEAASNDSPQPDPSQQQDEPDPPADP